MSVIGNTALSFTEEQAMLLDVATQFCRDKSPISAVRAELETDSGYDADLWQEMCNLGWTGITAPEALGGSGLGVGALVPVIERMGGAMLGTPLMSTSLAVQALLRAGNSEQQERLLPDLVAGAPATVALLENGDWGSQAIGVTLGADGTLSGVKKHVADAAAATLFVVSASRDGNPVLAIVRADQLAEGALRHHTLIDQTKRSADVDFTGVTVDAGNVIEGDAVATALRDIVLIGALLVAAEATGSASACLNTTVDYLNTRKQFGKLIGSYQALKHPAVQILLDLDSAKSFVYHAATLISEAPLDEDAEVACRMAKAQATETLRYAGDRAVQFHGGMGFTYECDAQLYIRRAQWSQQQFGDAQHHRKRLAVLLLDR